MYVINLSKILVQIYCNSYNYWIITKQDFNLSMLNLIFRLLLQTMLGHINYLFYSYNLLTNLIIILCLKALIWSYVIIYIYLYLFTKCI